MDSSICCGYYDPSGDFNDEELAMELQAQELVLGSPIRSGPNDASISSVIPEKISHYGMNNTESFVQVDENRELMNFASKVNSIDLELAKALQLDEDEMHMVVSAAEFSNTDLELAKMLQFDDDEIHMFVSAEADKETDHRLAMALQSEEEIAASDFLIAMKLQEDLEVEHQPERIDRPGPDRVHGNRDVSHHERTTDDLGFRPHQFMQYGIAAVDGVEEPSYEELLEVEEAIGEAEQQGLAEEEIAALPTSHFRSRSHVASAGAAADADSSGSSNCYVCFSDFTENAALRTLPCLHRFHRDCIDEWIKRKAVCPVCRITLKEQMFPNSVN